MVSEQFPQNLRITDLSDFAGEARVFDLRLAELLGYERPRNIRNIIRRNMAELLTHEQAPHDGAQFHDAFDAGISRHDGAKIPTLIDDGISLQVAAKNLSGIAPQVAAKNLSPKRRGRPEEAFLLNEAQAILVTMLSRTPTAAEVRRQIIAVFMAWRHGRLILPAGLPMDDLNRAQDRRSTSQERFIAECNRVASEQGMTVEQLLAHEVSRQELSAIEKGKGPMDKLLTRDQRWARFLGVGMDLHYVLTGVWSYTPQERQVIAQLRGAQAVHKIEHSGLLLQAPD